MLLDCCTYRCERVEPLPDSEYDAEQKTIWFPKAKKEENRQNYPCTSGNLVNLEAWENGYRKSASSISNQFTKFKQGLGYDGSHDFHSFRRTFLTMC